MGRFAVEMEVANDVDMAQLESGKLGRRKVRRMNLRGVVDSGAARLVLPKAVVEELGLTPAGKLRVRYADGRSALRQTVKRVYVELLGRSGSCTAIVEPNRTAALIGAIVLEDLDLLVDCSNEKLVPRDPRFVVSEIEELDLSAASECPSHVPRAGKPRGHVGVARGRRQGDKPTKGRRLCHFVTPSPCHFVISFVPPRSACRPRPS